MNTNLIIGMGKYGQHLCYNLASLGCEVVVIDQNEEKLEDILNLVVSAKIGDCTKPEVLRSLGIGNFDNVFVCMRDDFQSSLEITSLVKEMGARTVISLAARTVQAKFLLRNGADEVIYPERDSAIRVAKRCSSDSIFDYIELSKHHSIYEIKVAKAWIGKSLRELNIRAKLNINVVGIKDDDENNFNIDPDYKFKEGDHVYALAHNEEIKDLLKKLDKEEKNEL